jgi:hypothetical protein
MPSWIQASVMKREGVLGCSRSPLPSAGSTEPGEGPFGDLPTRQDDGILNSRRDDRRSPTQRAAIVVFGQNFRIRSIPPFPRALRNDRYLRAP